MSFHDPPGRFQSDLCLIPIGMLRAHFGPHHVHSCLPHPGDDSPTPLDRHLAQPVKVKPLDLFILKLAER